MDNGWMLYERTTQVPNIVFDTFLPQLSLAELKLLLIVIRQTNGWVSKRTGKRKERDRISHSQFIKKTGLSRRIITTTIQSLIDKGFITVSDYRHNILDTPLKRKGRTHLFYAFSFSQPVQLNARTCAPTASEPVQISLYNKTKYKKLTITKESRMLSIRKIIEVIEKEIKTSDVQ